MTDRAGLKPRKLQGLGLKATTEALLGHVEVAQIAVSEGELVLAEHGRVANAYLTAFLLGRLLTHIQLLGDAMQSNNRSGIQQYQKIAYRAAKLAVRASKKFAVYRTWILRLMGYYDWLVGNQRKAMKWYDGSIKEGERLGARLDLSRTYFEVGKHLLESESKYKQLNGIDATGYLEKAEKLFKKMGLEHDLDELERVRSQM